MSKSRIALAAAGAFAVALVFAFGVARATDPPGLFPKYLAAVAAPAAEQAERLQDYSPLYLALTRALADHGYQAVLAVQCLLLGVIAAAVAWVVAMLAGAGWGFAAGVGVATYRPFLVYAGVHEPEMLVLTALAVAVVAGLMARRSAGFATLVAAAVAAGALSAAALARPQYLALVPFWAAWMASGRTTRDSPARRREIVALVVLTLLVPVLLLGAFLFSRSADRRRGFMIMDPGAVFYEGNGPGATGLIRFAPPAILALEDAATSAYDYGHVAYRRIATSALAPGGEPVSPTASNRYWTQLGWEGIRARPGRALARWARKTTIALGPYEAHDLLAAEQLDRRLRPRLPWGFVLPLVALPWIVFASAERRRELAGPLLVAALAFAVQVGLYASARQRLPLALALWIVGPVLAADLVRGRLKTAVRPTLVALLGVAVALGCAGLSARPALLYDRGWTNALGPEPPSLGARLTAWSEGRGLRRGLARDARRFDAGVRARTGRASRPVAPRPGAAGRTGGGLHRRRGRGGRG